MSKGVFARETGRYLGEYWRTVVASNGRLHYVAEDIIGNLTLHRADNVVLRDPPSAPQPPAASTPSPSSSPSPLPPLSTFDFVFRETYSALLRDHNHAGRSVADICSLVERARQAADIAARAVGEIK